MFSIVVVSWKNLPFLKTLISSIQKNSVYTHHQLLIHVQEGCGETEQWLNSKKIQYTMSENNIGLSAAANMAARKADHNFICLVDDDMYVLPRWDKELVDFVEWHALKRFWVVSTMLERAGQYTLKADFGKSPEEFDEADLLRKFGKYKNKLLPVINNSALPGLIPTQLWFDVGGYDEDFPVIGSEIGLAKKLWDSDCRNVGITVPKSLVYHFQAASTRKLQNLEVLQVERDDKFLAKYGVTLREFRDKELKKGQPWDGYRRSMSIPGKLIYDVQDFFN
jgi:GT2 family glycosyltransferase